MRGFELFQLVEQAVEFAVGDFGAGLDVIEAIVPPNLLPQLFDAMLRGRHECLRHYGGPLAPRADIALIVEREAKPLATSKSNRSPLAERADHHLTRPFCAAASYPPPRSLSICVAAGSTFSRCQRR